MKLMKNCTSIILALSLLAPNCALADDKIIDKTHGMISFADIVEPLMPSVVNIYTVKYAKRQQQKDMPPVPDIVPFERFNDFFEQFNVPFSFNELYSNPRALSLGSGFVVDEAGLIVTNHHVVAGSDEVSIKFSDNTELPAKIIGSDPKTDLALLRVESKKKLVPIKFGNSNDSRVGDVVIAIGNPLGFGGTVTTGIISSKGRDLGSGIDELVDDFIQTDAAINTGNSGGPLFNINGEVIGVNTAIPAAGGGTNIGIGFAIPSKTVKEIIAKLEANGKVSRGRLDIAIQEVTKELADALSPGYDYGALIVDVKPGGTGDKAGLTRGDLIVEFNGNKVLNGRKLQLFVADAEIGSKVKLGIIRNGKKVELDADIVDIESEDALVKKKPKKATHSIVVGGIRVANLSPAIISSYDIAPDATGIVVTDIEDVQLMTDLRPGDVIVAMDQQKVDNIDQFKSNYEKLKASSNKKNAVLLIKRGDMSLFVALKAE